MLRVVVLFCLLTGSAFAQQKSLLWEVSGNGLKQPSYLYGTFHLLCQKDLKISPTAMEKLKDAGQMYLEIDMDDPQEMSSMMNNMYLKGQTLKDLTDSTDYAFLSRFYQDSLHISLAAVGKMKPFMLMSLLYPKLLGCSPGSPELVFMQAASTAKKPIMGLEKAADQFAVIDKPGPKKTAEQLVKFVREYEKSRKEFNEMLDLYRQQDVEALYRLTESQPDYADQIEDLLWNRNANWIGVLEKAMAEKATFVAVGAGHLGGPKGVLALLRAKGYQIRAL